jgi:hypothetical protein
MLHFSACDYFMRGKQSWLRYPKDSANFYFPNVVTTNSQKFSIKGITRFLKDDPLYINIKLFLLYTRKSAFDEVLIHTKTYCKI